MRERERERVYRVQKEAAKNTENAQTLAHETQKKAEEAECF
jgi:hypothetical protein